MFSYSIPHECIDFLFSFEFFILQIDQAHGLTEDLIQFQVNFIGQNGQMDEHEEMSVKRPFIPIVVPDEFFASVHQPGQRMDRLLTGSRLLGD